MLFATSYARSDFPLPAGPYINVCSGNSSNLMELRFKLNYTTSNYLFSPIALNSFTLVVS